MIGLVDRVKVSDKGPVEIGGCIMHPEVRQKQQASSTFALHPDRGDYHIQYTPRNV